MIAFVGRPTGNLTIYIVTGKNTFKAIYPPSTQMFDSTCPNIAEYMRWYIKYRKEYDWKEINYLDLTK